MIDNNSTDATPDVVETFALMAPFPARRVFEPRQGSSFARNRAVREAQRELIFFIDDDVIVEADWAEQLLAEIRPARPRRRLRIGARAMAGGAAPMAGRGGLRQAGGASRDRLQRRAPPEKLSQFFSANVGLKRECFERFGLFREDLGVVGDNPMSGEDTELFEPHHRRRRKIGIAPRAVVHHMIGPERMTRAYFRRKSFAFGVGSAFGGGRSHNRADKLVRNLLRMAAAAARGNQPLAFYHQLECVNFFGYWYGRIKLRRARAPQA